MHDLGVRAKVFADVLDHEAELPALERLQGLAKFFPTERAPVHHGVVGGTAFAFLAPDEAPDNLVTAGGPAGAVRAALEVLSPDFLLGAPADVRHERARFRVVGPEDRKAVTFACRQTAFLERDFDTSRRPPNAEREVVSSSIGPDQTERRGGIWQFGVAGDLRDPPVCTSVTQGSITKPDARVGCAAVFTPLISHRHQTR